MLFDTHLHTDFSTDSEMKAKDLFALSKKENLGFIITEHMDLHYPKPDLFVFSVEDYFQKFQDYRNPNFLLGIEIGLRPDCLAENRQLAENRSFDFVIGSIHVVNELDLYYKPFYAHKDKQAAYLTYFSAMLRCLKETDFIDTLGHIDYIARYAPYDDPEVHYHEFAEAIDAVLRLVADKGIALEINTRRLNERKVIEDLLPIYRRFHAVGGEYVTLGSDAHRLTDVGSQLNIAWEMAQACQLQPVYFEKRQMKVMCLE